MRQVISGQGQHCGTNRVRTGACEVEVFLKASMSKDLKRHGIR
jgi:hypothetical protein